MPKLLDHGCLRPELRWQDKPQLDGFWHGAITRKEVLWGETAANKPASYDDTSPYVHTEWSMFLDDRLVGTLVGSQLWFAPQPR